MPNNTWLAYPQNKPNEHQKFDEFLVAYQNPYFIKKKGYSSHIPTHRFEIMEWTGNSWVNYNRRQITHFQTLPPLPEN